MITFIILFSLVLTVQSLFTLVWMLYAWQNPKPDDSEIETTPIFFPPWYSFTALIPARHEAKVIKDTIEAVNKINYPDSLKEVLILCRQDDQETIEEAQKKINELGKPNIKLLIFNSLPVNKPHGLNYGLRMASNEIITIFDAEDEPSTDIFNVINRVMIHDQADVVQSGVQLMNYREHWFSALNVMEYFMWFKSGLHFFLRLGAVTPLGGNTVFFHKSWLQKINGWDETCLTEDADIGIRLILAGAQIKIIYEEKYVTREETPASVFSFIKQRTRWNQGFLQIIFKGDWLKLPSIRQKLMALYFLLSPFVQASLLLYTPIAIWVAITQRMPLVISLFSFVPLYLFILQIIVQIVGLYEFTKAYSLKFPFWMPIKMVLLTYPYQFVLMISSLRALYRKIFSQNSWEKTFHLNSHRRLTYVK